MSIDYLLDMGVANLVALEDATTLGRITSARMVLVPEIVFGELYFGAYIYAHEYASTKYL